MALARGRPHADPMIVAATHVPMPEAPAAREPDAATAAIELYPRDARERAAGQSREPAEARRGE